MGEESATILMARSKGGLRGFEAFMPMLMLISYWLVPQELRVGGVTTTFLIQVGLIALMLLKGGTVPGRDGRLQRWVLVGLALFLLVTAGALLANYNQVFSQLSFMASQGFRTEGLYEKMVIAAFLAVLTCAAAFVHGISLGRNEARRTNFMTAFIGLGLVAGLVNLAAWFSETHGIIARYNYLPPITGSSGITQLRMWTLMVLALGLRLDPHQRPMIKLLCSITSLVAMLNVATIVTRLGWIHAGIAVAMLAFLLRPYLPPQVRKVLPWATVLTILAAILLAGIFFGKEFSSAFDTVTSSAEGGEDSTLNRFILLQHGAAMIEAHPWLGVGYGQFALFSTVPTIISGQEVYVASAHNGLIMILSECGGIGLVLCLFLNVQIFRILLGKLRRLTGRREQILVRTLFPVVAIAVFGQMFSNSDITPLPAEASSVQQALLLWMFIGLCSGLPERLGQAIKPYPSC